MKLRKILALMLALALSLTMLQGVAFGAVGTEFDAKVDVTNNGTTSQIDMKFKVLTEDATTKTGTVQVGSENILNGNTYAQAIDESTPGALDIPATVTHTDGGTTYTYTVTSIGVSAFWYCDKLTSVTLPDSLTSIGEFAFSSCEKLLSIDIPNSVTSIESSAFYSCDELTSVTLPDGLTTIGNNMFSGCIALVSINIPNSVTSIGRNAFRGCTSLTSLTLPDGLETIVNSAFSYCEALTSISIPAGVTSIEASVFLGCKALTSVTFEGRYSSGMEPGMIGLLDLSQISTITYPHGDTSWKTYIDTLTDAQKANFQEGAPTGGGSGSTGGGSAGAGAWYIGTLNGADGQPTYTQIVDTADTTAMLNNGNVITVIGQSPTGVIVKLDPTALAGKQSLSINSSIADMQLTAEQIASLIQQAGDNTIHITIKGTPDGSTISILAGGRTITL